MKGYKAFKKGMICDPTGNNPFQYAENTVYEQDKEVRICESGFHFCKNPLDVLEYYPLIDENGDVSEFAEVEALDEVITNDSKKYCTKKIKIGAKIDFPKLVQASVDFELEKGAQNITNDNGGNSARIGSSGYYAKIGSSGNYAQIGSSGDCARIGSSGYYAQIGSSGNYAQIGSSGDCAQIGSSGYCARIGSSGDCARIGSSGNYAQIGSSGYCARIGSSGYCARIGSSGDCAQIGSSGDCAQIGSSGNYARIVSTGEDSVICCSGFNNQVKAKKGSWITLSEWEYDNEKNRNIPICVKTEYVDGKRIKEDTFYELRNGEFTEVK